MFKRMRALKCATAMIVAAGAVIVVTSNAQSSQLVYQPTNPAFGGDPFVGTYLLETARAQNRYGEDQPGFPDINIPDFNDIIVIPPGNGDDEGGAEAFVNQAE